MTEVVFMFSYFSWSGLARLSTDILTAPKHTVMLMGVLLLQLSVASCLQIL